MLWPFNHFLKPRTPLRGTIETIYGMIVAQAREPLFYQALGVPDTVNGRFDMVVLHVWMVLRQMKRLEHVPAKGDPVRRQGHAPTQESTAHPGDVGSPGDPTSPGSAVGEAAGLAQPLFDRFCSDMDHNLRELGTGDLAVPKRMQEFGEAFYGRSMAYDLAIAAGEGALAQALCKNIFNGRQFEQARRLAVYVERALEILAVLDEAKLSAAAWQFPSPAPAAVPE